MATGILGFDELSYGGLKPNRTTLLMGGPGSGKTVFALQTLVNAARERNEPGIFVAFEETTRQLIANAAGFDWRLGTLAKGKLFFFEAQLSPEVVQSGEFDLRGMLAMLKAKKEEIGARWIVFDGIDVLLTLLQSPIAEMREIYRIRDWLADNAMNAIVTAKIEGSMSTAVNYDFMQFMMDCVIRLSRRIEHGVSLHRLQITKYRGSDFVAGEHPVSFGPSGMEIGAPEPPEIKHTAPIERVSAGFERLDRMLGGGFVRSGERNRALTIIKSRGTWHSNQVRELLLSKAGPVLTDVYTAGGEVLMGTLRWEKEQEGKADTTLRQVEFDQKRADLEVAEADTHARITALQLSLERQRVELAQLSSDNREDLVSSSEREQELGRIRSADPERRAPAPPPQKRTGSNGSAKGKASGPRSAR